MTDYRVTKTNSKNEAIEHKNFDDQANAEKYAEKTSLYDDNHSYEVQKKENEKDDYQTVKIFKQGQEVLSFDDIRRKK